MFKNAKWTMLAVAVNIFSSYTYAETALGCGNVPTNTDELHIYSGPNNFERILPGTYKFKAKENIWDGGWGSNLTWYLKLKNEHNGLYQTVYEKGDTFDFDGTDNQYIDHNQRGSYCSVIVSGGYCNNRCYFVQNLPTANGNYEASSQESIPYNTSIQFTGEGVVDTLATNNHLEYQWNFDDGTASKEKNSTHIFNKAGTYPITLTTFDGKFYSQPDTVGVIWIRGPAQPPRHVRYEFGSCSNTTRMGSIEWERSGVSFEVQRPSGGSWANVYVGTNNNMPYNSSGGTKTLRVRSFDNVYGGPSAWKSISFSVPTCSGGGVEPL